MKSHLSLWLLQLFICNIVGTIIHAGIYFLIEATIDIRRINSWEYS